MKFLRAHRFLLGVLGPLSVLGYVAVAAGPLLGRGLRRRVLAWPRSCGVQLSSSEGALGVLLQQILIEVFSVLLDKVVDFFSRSSDFNLLVFLNIAPDNLFD